MRRRQKRSDQVSGLSSTDQPRREGGYPSNGDAAEMAALIRRHLRFGWSALGFYLLLGLVLEGLHGLKVSWYLEVSYTTRRHMWTLAHAHGTLLAVLNLILAGTVRLVSGWSRRHRSLASACFIGAAILLPAGFFLGGCFIHDGDPGVGIVLVPVGAILLLIAVVLAARAQ